MPTPPSLLLVVSCALCAEGEMTLWKTQVHPKNVLKDLTKTLEDIFRFSDQADYGWEECLVFFFFFVLLGLPDAVALRDLSFVVIADENPRLECTLFYDFQPVAPDCPLLLSRYCAVLLFVRLRVLWAGVRERKDWLTRCPLSLHSPRIAAQQQQEEQAPSKKGRARAGTVKPTGGRNSAAASASQAAGSTSGTETSNAPAQAAPSEVPGDSES